MPIRTCRSLLVSLAILVVLSACGGDTTQPVPPPTPPPAPPPPPPPPPPPAPVASVTVTPAASTLVPQQTVQLTAVTRDAGGNVLNGRTIVWTSGTPAAASVGATGLVTGLLPGAPVITATSEGQAGTAAITVLDGGLATPAGGTVTAAGGEVVLTFPAGAVGTTVGLTVAPSPNPPAHPHLIPGTGWALGPDGTGFTQPVTVSLRYPDGPLPDGLTPDHLAVHRWNGSAWVPLTDRILDAANRRVSGRTSGFSTFAVVGQPPNPLPTLTSISPATALVGGAAFTLTATGGNFTPQSVIEWNGAPQPTTFVSTTALTAAIPASSLLASGTVQVTVLTPAPGGGTSNPQSFVVTHPPPTVIAVAAGGNHTCVILADGAAACWGLAGDGVPLDDDAPGGASTPVPVAGGHQFVAITAGGRHTCALDGDGAAWCWGRNTRGQLGNGSTAGSSTPVKVSGSHQFARISAGTSYTCGVTVHAAPLCWGANDFGQLGVTNGGNDATTPTAVQGGHSFAEISAGADHTCALTPSNMAWCWGLGIFGKLGDDTGPDAMGWWHFRNTPVAVVTGFGFSSIAVGRNHSCALTPAGQAYCWGFGAGGQTGLGTSGQAAEAQLVPALVLGSHTFSAITAGEATTCARSPDGTARCWGAGFTLGAGSGIGQLSAIPVTVSGGHGFAQVSTGQDHTCGVTDAGAVLCWGSGADGKVGDPTNQVRFVPFAVNWSGWVP